MEKLFSYGTLQDKPVQIANFGRELTGHKDVLVGFRQTSIPINDPEVVRQSGKTHHPMIVPDQASREEIAGTVFDLTPDELKSADAYEVPEYKRVSVRLKSGTEAWVYAMA